MKIYPDFNVGIRDLTKKLLLIGAHLQPNNWQSMDVSKRKEAETIELLNYSLAAPIYTTDLSDLAYDIRPNLPWVDEHFIRERVFGEPINPGETWKTWPWGLSADKFRKDGQQFDHSYAERYWPKYAGQTPGGIFTENWPPAYNGQPLFRHRGIRYPYGDLDNVVERLVSDPLTRQAVLSVWHPEDQHNGGQRVPCSLFYHFIHRNGYLHMVYTIRSCDALRHFRDDIYLTVRLLLWVLDRLKEKDSSTWGSVKPGIFTMHITSFHCFIGDINLLEKSIEA